MIDLPDLPALSAALTDRRFVAAVAIAALSGFVRGFSGLRFGADLYSADRRGVRAAHRRADAAADRSRRLRRRSRSVVPAAATGARCCRSSIAAAVAVPLGTMALLLRRSNRAALVHRRAGHRAAGGAGVRLALPRPPIAAGHGRRRLFRGARQRRGADRRSRGHHLLARRRERCRDRARQPDGVLPADGRGHGHRLSRRRAS